MTCSLAVGRVSGSAAWLHRLSIVSCRWVTSLSSAISVFWKTTTVRTAISLSRGTSTTWNTYQSVFSAISVFWNTTTVWTAISLYRTTWNTYQSVENISLSRDINTTCEIRINLYSMQSLYSETQRPTVWTALSLYRTTWNTYQSVFSAISVFWNTTTDRMNISQSVQDNMKYVSICILCNLRILKHNDRINSSQSVQDYMKYVSICFLCNLGILKHNDRPYEQLSVCTGQHEIRINLYSLQSLYSETQRPYKQLSVCPGVPAQHEIRINLYSLQSQYSETQRPTV